MLVAGGARSLALAEKPAELPTDKHAVHRLAPSLSPNLAPALTPSLALTLSPSLAPTLSPSLAPRTGGYARGRARQLTLTLTLTLTLSRWLRSRASRAAGAWSGGRRSHRASS